MFVNTRRAKRNGTKRKMEEDTATETVTLPPSAAEVVNIIMRCFCAYAVSHVGGTIGSLCSINSVIVHRGIEDSYNCCYSQADTEAPASPKARGSKKRKVSSVKDDCKTEAEPPAAGSDHQEADNRDEAAVDGDAG